MIAPTILSNVGTKYQVIIRVIDSLKDVSRYVVKYTVLEG